MSFFAQYQAPNATMPLHTAAKGLIYFHPNATIKICKQAEGRSKPSYLVKSNILDKHIRFTRGYHS